MHLHTFLSQPKEATEAVLQLIMFLFSFALDLPLQYFFFLFSPRLLDVEGRVEGGRQRLRAAGGEQGQEHGQTVMLKAWSLCTKSNLRDRILGEV